MPLHTIEDLREMMMMIEEEGLGGPPTLFRQGKVTDRTTVAASSRLPHHWILLRLRLRCSTRCRLLPWGMTPTAPNAEATTT